MTLPIVAVGATMPVEVGLVKSLARPGGNITGVTSDVDPEQVAKLVELLAEIPSVSRIAVLWSAGYPAAERYRRELERAAAARKRTLRFVEVLKPEDFDAAFATLRRLPAEGLIVMADQLTLTRGADIVRVARDARLATAFGGPGKSLRHRGRPDVALRGLQLVLAAGGDLHRQDPQGRASPADLPVEQPTKFDLVVNVKTARALGLTLPPALLQRADEVIE